MVIAANSPMIELSRLRRSFGDTLAVDDVSFEVRRGEVFGYIGPNGAGKTTSMRILATLDLPDHGDAYVDGFSVVDDPDRVRRRLGFMPDAFGTYPNVNCWEYLDFFARAYGLRGGERQRALARVMDFTGLDKLAHKPTQGLSKGMKQRLCLGRALVHDPAVLVLDEPAAGLDPRARIELRQMIRALAEQGTTILVSSHILSELGEMCDRVGIIEKGALVAVGTVDEIHHDCEATREVRIRVLGDIAPVAAWLAARNDVAEVRADGELLLVAHAGDQRSEVELLRSLVEAGFAVAEFHSRPRSLEDVFMRITKGEVQ